jgi:hypothetical protein
MPRRRLLSVIVALSVAVVLLGACKAKPGGKCSGAGAMCTDKTQALFCIDDTFVVIHCRGDKGCAPSGSLVECDESIAVDGEACNAPDAIACATDGKSALKCDGKKFVVDETCKGPTGCKVEGGQKIACDNDVSDVGDPCHFAGDYACTTDKSLALRCDDGKMTPLNTCRGPRQCRIVPMPKHDRPEVLCDDSIAQDGDPCDTNSEEACSMDKKGMLVCKGNKFTGLVPCPGGCLYEEKTDHYTCVGGGGGPPLDGPSPPAPPPKRKNRRT